MADDIFLTENQYTLYRGKPLVRAGNMLCYGNMSDKYVLFMMVLSEKDALAPNGDTIAKIPDNILIQILTTDQNEKNAIAKQLNAQGLFDALDLGIVWLDRLNAE